MANVNNDAGAAAAAVPSAAAAGCAGEACHPGSPPGVAFAANLYLGMRYAAPPSAVGHSARRPADGMLIGPKGNTE